MIIFFGNGRLGNQLFQYAFIKNFVKRKELIITYNFNDLLKLFEVKDRIMNIRNRYLQIVIKRVLIDIFKILSRLRLISSVKVKRDLRKNFSVEGKEYIYTNGFLPTLFIYPGYFQSEVFFNKKNLKDLKIRQKYIKHAQKVLREVDSSRKKIFVHLRRGDFADQTILGCKNIVLPLDYYKKCLHRFKNSFFVFMSDDVNFVKRNFQNINNKIVSEESSYIDFTIMTLCSGGIMSNSSFSWWGGYFCTNREFLVAPKYWLGFRSNTEIPIGILPSFAKAVNFSKD